MEGSTGYFPHGADIGVVGRGSTVEEAFVHAAEAMFAIMCDLTPDHRGEPLEVTFTEDDLELALATWLNLLLSAARVEGIAPSRFDLRREGDVWSGHAWGEPWNDNLQPGVEVKGATLTGLSVLQQGERWEARCVVDV